MTKGDDRTITENLQEAFQIRRPLADDDPDLLAGKSYHGVIPWPSAMPDLKPRMMGYFDKLSVLGYALLALFEESLELAPGRLQQFFAKDMNSLRLLHYPPQAPDAPAEHLGARAHTDTNAFTILAQDDEWRVRGPQPRRRMACGAADRGHARRQRWRNAEGVDRRHLLVDGASRDQSVRPRALLNSVFMYPSYDAVIFPILCNPDPANVAPEDLATRRCRATGRSSTANSRRKARRGSCRAK